MLNGWFTSHGSDPGGARWPVAAVFPSNRAIADPPGARCRYTWNWFLGEGSSAAALLRRRLLGYRPIWPPLPAGVLHGPGQRYLIDMLRHGEPDGSRNLRR